jgi:hypothetical protein
VRAHQPAEPSAQREARHAGGRDDAAGGRLAVHVGRPVVLVPGGPALGPSPMATWIDVHPAHQGQVDHQPAVGDRPAGHVVTTSPHRYLEPAVTPEVHGLPHVGHVVAARDQPGTFVHQPVVHRPDLVVGGITGRHERAAEPAGQLVGHRHLDHGSSFRRHRAICARWTVGIQPLAPHGAGAPSRVPYRPVSPSRTAAVAASMRDDTPSLMRMLDTWCSAVLRLM